MLRVEFTATNYGAIALPPKFDDCFLQEPRTPRCCWRFYVIDPSHLFTGNVVSAWGSTATHPKISHSFFKKNIPRRRFGRKDQFHGQHEFRIWIALRVCYEVTFKVKHMKQNQKANKTFNGTYRAYHIIEAWMLKIVVASGKDTLLMHIAAGGKYV